MNPAPTAPFREIAAVDKVSSSYVSRILRISLLAPKIAEAILDGRQPAEVTLAALMKPFVLEWEEQRQKFDVGGGRSQ